MPIPNSLRRFTLCAAVLLPLLSLSRVGARGQNAKAGTTHATATTAVAAPEPSVSGTGEQMRAIAVICDDWEEMRKREAKKGAKKVSKDGPQDSSDIRDYDFTVTQEATVFKIKLSPRNPAVIKSATPQGTYVTNNSSVFYYDVRRSDFKIVGASMVL